MARVVDIEPLCRLAVTGGPVDPGDGEGSSAPVHLHELSRTKSMVKRAAVGDQLQIVGAGLTCAEADSVGVFHQAYGSRGCGAVVEMPVLEILLP